MSGTLGGRSFPCSSLASEKEGQILFQKKEDESFPRKHVFHRTTDQVDSAIPLYSWLIVHKDELSILTGPENSCERVRGHSLLSAL